ncbi:hypothetical protein HMPREF9104_02994 [Lentilactobacillus kisonensis F0435]|nr:hypothetical protein HMPREF9104_02994 [Lentilactobacillus kisonensis F0435]
MLYIVGLGPGSQQLMTQEAIETIKKVDTIVGYITYIHLVEDMIKGKDIVTTGMRGEIERSKKAIEIAETGKDVAIISSGDAGI